MHISLVPIIEHHSNNQHDTAGQLNLALLDRTGSCLLLLYDYVSSELTSGILRLTFYSVINDGPGSLAIMPHPAARDSLRSDIAWLAESGFDIVVSLLTPAEEQELELFNEPSLAVEYGMRFVSCPVPDMSVPDDLPAFAELAFKIVKLIQDGRNVLVHCRGGIGRSGLLASAVLVLMGYEPSMVFEFVTRARGENIPETRKQADWFTGRYLPYLSDRKR